MQGYIEARLIDEKVNKLIEKYPMTRENALNWMNFCRTIISGLNILNIEAKDLLKPLGSDGEKGAHR